MVFHIAYFASSVSSGLVAQVCGVSDSVFEVLREVKSKLSVMVFGPERHGVRQGVATDGIVGFGGGGYMCILCSAAIPENGIILCWVLEFANIGIGGG